MPNDEATPPAPHGAASGTSPDAPAPDPNREWARRLHEHTAEVELLISGALIFGLAQAPGHLDAWFDAVRLRLDGGYNETVFLGWYYAKLITYTLIGSFSLHILARAYWVGLLGLDSVFPDGIRWEKLRYGPIAKDEYRAHIHSLPTLARRADDFAGTIFSLAFWIVLLFVMSVVMSGVAGALALAVRSWILPDVAVGVLWLWAVTAAAAIPLVSVTLDRVVGGRLARGGRVQGGIRRTIRWAYYLFAGPLLMPIQFTLFSNVKRGVMWTILGVYFLGLMTFFVVGENLRRGDWILSASEAFPTRTGAAAADSRYYESADPDPDVPTIQSDIVRGPYVRLRVPFVARRDGDRLRERCPALPTLGRRGVIEPNAADPPPSPAEESALLGCMAGLWRVRLDGAPVVPEWVFDASGSTGIRGLAAYFATAALLPGAHTLEIAETPEPSTAPAPAAGAADGDEEARVRRWFIRFWI